MEALLYTLAGEQQRGEKMERKPGKTAHVRRNLFGPVDHEQLQQDFQNTLHSSIERARQKWNFDFLRDTPVEGLLQWEEMEGHQVPPFYRSCVVGSTRRPLQHLNLPLGREDKVQHFAQVILTEKSKTSKKTGGKKSPERKKRRQTSLTGVASEVYSPETPISAREVGENKGEMKADYYSAKKQVKTNIQAAAKKSTP